MNYTLKNKIFQAAEAVIYQDGDKIIKKRVSKGYRIKEIDTELIKQRTSTESKIMDKAKRNKINVPLVYFSDKDTIVMSLVLGKQVKDVINKDNYKEIIPKVSEQVTRLHDSDIVHGDLTTSNMILQGEDVFLIDFGLSQNSKKVEDKAVDIYLLKQAINSKHHQISDSCFKLFLEKYKSKNKENIVSQLESIEKRRRYTEGS